MRNNIHIDSQSTRAVPQPVYPKLLDIDLVTILASRSNITNLVVRALAASSGLSDKRLSASINRALSEASVSARTKPVQPNPGGAKHPFTQEFAGAFKRFLDIFDNPRTARAEFSRLLEAQAQMPTPSIKVKSWITGVIPRYMETQSILIDAAKRVADVADSDEAVKLLTYMSGDRLKTQIQFWLGQGLELAQIRKISGLNPSAFLAWSNGTAKIRTYEFESVVEKLDLALSSLNKNGLLEHVKGSVVLATLDKWLSVGLTATNIRKFGGIDRKKYKQIWVAGEPIQKLTFDAVVSHIEAHLLGLATLKDAFNRVDKERQKSELTIEEIIKQAVRKKMEADSAMVFIEQALSKFSERKTAVTNN